MSPTMLPPPPRNPYSSSSMAPPPLPKPSPPLPSAHQEAEAGYKPSIQADGTTKPGSSSSMPPQSRRRGTSPSEVADAVPPKQRPLAPYAIPDWSAAPEHPFFLEVIEDSISYDNLDLSKKEAYIFGRADPCDILLEHPSISRFHAVLQFRNDGKVFLYDLGSTHGSSINKTQIKKKMYTEISIGEIIQFGQSSRMYIFQGPSELMRPADEAGNSGGNTKTADTAQPEQRQQQLLPHVPYAIPDWSATPKQPFFLEVLKNSVFYAKLDVSKKGAYILGRADRCDIVLEHPSISRFHAVLQFRNDGEVFLCDLGSTHGSSINKTQINKHIYTKIHVGDLIQFGQSSRRYIFQGPCELMSPGKDIEKLCDAKIGQDMLDSEASHPRAKTQAASEEGVSWGMSEDAPEEFEEDEADEITWQTYKGQLTDRQERTRGKIIKQMEKVANMKTEIVAIRAKDISHGGLSQRQQTKIAQNEQRIPQIMEEVENLEVTLNDSIQESLGAPAGKPKCGRHKASLEEDVVSDDDEFYDRTKKKSSRQQSSGKQSIETADNLLEKKNIITNDIEDKKKLLEEEKNKLAQRCDVDLEDVLDVYMSGLLSQLAHDNIIKIQKELSDLQAQLDRVVYLLKVADPMEEADHKRDLKPREANAQASDDNPGPESKKQEKIAQIKVSTENSKDSCLIKTEVDKSAEVETDVSRNQENVSKPAFTIPKPQARKSKGKESKTKCLLGPARPDFLEACPD